MRVPVIQVMVVTPVICNEPPAIFAADHHTESIETSRLPVRIGMQDGNPWSTFGIIVQEHLDTSKRLSIVSIVISLNQYRIIGVTTAIKSNLHATCNEQSFSITCVIAIQAVLNSFNN